MRKYQFLIPACRHQTQIRAKRVQLYNPWNINAKHMKICMQGNFRAENSNMDVTFTYLEYVTPGMTSPNLNRVKRVQLYNPWNINAKYMKICMQGNFRAENSNMDVTFTYLAHVTPGMTSPNPNTGNKGPTL